MPVVKVNKCCATPADCGPSTKSPDSVRESVREGYAEIARTGAWSSLPNATGGGGCCGNTELSPERLAQAIVYATADLLHLPEGANLGLSCGNPTALAGLQPGEVVLDLGSGAGFDCFLAGPRVGPTGRVIGIDMTAEMLSKARGNLAAYREKSGLNNVEFRLGEIEHLPLADASVDVVLSNCVLNLSTDKPQVWREIVRVLKLGGRVAISDLALLQPLPPEVANDLEALVGCIAGAAMVTDIQTWATAAGLTNLQLRADPTYINTMTDARDPLYKRIIAALPEGSTPADFVTSLEVQATRPLP